MPNRFQYDYYRVNVPSDCEEDPEKRAQLAFIQAEEMTRVYAIPCEWAVLEDDGSDIRVRRKRNRRTRA